MRITEDKRFKESIKQKEAEKQGALFKIKHLYYNGEFDKIPEIINSLIRPQTLKDQKSRDFILSQIPIRYIYAIQQAILENMEISESLSILKEEHEWFIQKEDERLNGKDRRLKKIQEEERKRRLERQRREACQNFFKEVKENSNPFQLDQDQTLAVVSNSQNTLLKARAGSGKTRTIIAKIIYAIEKQNIPPEKIKAFAFNKDAAKEINNRLKTISINGKKLSDAIGNIDIAQTFHSFAKQKLEKESKESITPLIDEKRNSIIKEITEKTPKEELYKYFRESYFDSPEISDSEYDKLKYFSFETLDGKTVRSRDEKIICDLLFEHGIDYNYEYTLTVGGNSFKNIVAEEYITEYDKITRDLFTIKPDFYLKDYEIFWEHWGISGTESLKEISTINKYNYIGNYYSYKQRMLDKKWLFSREYLADKLPKNLDKSISTFINSKDLLETHHLKTKNKTNYREEFEKYITSKLISRGIQLEKIPQKILIDKVRKKHINKFSKLIIQFIDKLQQSDKNEGEIALYIDECQNEKEKIFLKIALDCYREYLRESKKLETSKNRDFSMIIRDASKLIEINRDESFDLILIDEYQDFSNLFFDIINALRNCNPYYKFFCVGDDWQAINRFAGSDLNYFRSFYKYFKNPKILELSKNYRSSEDIVNFANDFINKSELDSRADIKAVNRSLEGDILLDKISGISGSVFKSGFFKEYYNRSEFQDNITKYLAFIFRLIFIQSNGRLGLREMMILSRTNNLNERFLDLSMGNVDNYSESISPSLEKFTFELAKKILPSITLKDFRQKVKFQTIHKSKGQESPTVVILDCDQKSIPKITEDTRLFAVFGEDLNTALSDEKRLFYVAATRAKKNLIFLHSEDNSLSEFIYLPEFPSLIRSKKYTDFNERIKQLEIYSKR